MIRVLVTGAGSYIGTRLEAYLNEFPERFNVAKMCIRDRRYTGLYEGAQGKAGEKRVQGGMTAAALYRKVNKEILRQNNMQYLLYEGIRSELYLQGIQLYPVFSLDEDHVLREKEIFESEIRPYLKIQELGESEPKQKQLHLCVKLLKPDVYKRQRQTPLQSGILNLPPGEGYRRAQTWYNTAMGIAVKTKGSEGLKDEGCHHRRRCGRGKLRGQVAQAG